MAQHGADAARHHRREPPATDAQDCVADGVDATVEPMQPPACHPPLDPAAIEPDIEQLTPAHHAVLPAGQGGESPIWGCLYTHTVY
jgi:hypothetical protein